ncbi:MAG: RNA 2',3'-cyclic phosphodiesterase [Geminocystis sp.]|nr:RNA 2',3'-cyclic phosphodiesterase [Geminocystis sp.]HIK36470.1 RNA 2',3'-cyclic phosphodiesterase [Geminocystis sp. M7585_C2015_104]
MRLFVGIFPSASMQKQLYQKADDWCGKLKTKVRLIPPPLLHLTLKFIGNVEKRRMEEVKRAFLAGVGRFSSISFQTQQIMLFPSPSQPRLVAVAIQDNPQLDSAFQFFDSAFTDFGVKSDKRPFRPHITVARSRYWQRETIQPSFFSLIEPITSISLVQSQLTPHGSVYTILESIPVDI